MKGNCKMPKKHDATINASSEDPRRAANSVITLSQFAHSKSKGTRRAIEHFKQKKQSKFNRKAGLLREYKKVMKSEGFEAGKGASRKRNRDESNKANITVQEEDEKPIRRNKSDPFAKAKEQARQHKVAELNRKLEHQQKMKKRALSEKKKKTKARKLAKRTTKGQPIMKNVIGDMLDKIRNDLT